MPLHGRISGSASVNGALQGSGTTDYNELNNKPKINNITLSGNKTAADLGLQDAISFPGDSSKYLDGSGNFSTPAGGSGDYEDLSNKPSINGVTLDGDNTSMSLGLEPAITYVGVDSMFYDGSGNFDYVSYNEVTDKPSINSHVISGNMSDSDLDINYENLNYLPMINNVTLTGDKTADDLGLQDKIIYPEDSTLFLDGEGNFRIPDYFSGDYDDLTDKPEINGITLEGDKSGNELELTSGPIASGTGTSVNFSSEGAYNLLKAEVEFEPVQDLHGYSKPWAGGAGKNKIPLTVNDIKSLNTGFTWIDNSFTYNGVTVTLNTDADGNLIKITTSGTCSGNFSFKLAENLSMPVGTYILSGSVGGNTSTYYFQGFGDIDYTGGAGILEADGETPFTLTATNNLIIRLHFRNGANMEGIELFPMVRESGESSNFEPYTNICNISGHNSVTINVSPSSDPSEGTDYTTAFDNTYYGGAFDFITGTIKNDYGYIPLYAGEVLPGEWLSSMDIYDPDNPTTPTIGAEVVYELSEPINHYVNKTVIESLIGENYVSASGKSVNVDAASEIYDPVLEYLVRNR